jgi:hypothetical protein
MAPTGLSDDDMPALFSDADQASLRAQATYLRLVRVDIALILVAAALGSASPSDLDTRAVLATISAVVFAATIVLSAALAVRRYDRTWFGGRAIAASVKTLAWRYAMRAEPYDIQNLNADKRFVADLRAIMEQRKYLATALIAQDADTARDQITEGMRRVRAAEPSKRKDVYLSDRVDDQRSWYRRKSSDNGKAEGRWFLVLVSAQIFGMVAAIVLVRWPSLPINAIGLFAAIAAASAAWMQVKRHQELAQSYAIAGNELGLIRSRGSRALSEAELSLFVSDAENAISREHTLWVARRDA